MVLLTIVHFLQFILLFLICSSVLLLFSYSVISACDPMIHSRTKSLSSTMSWIWLKFMSIQSVMPSNHLILCCLHFFFPNQRLFQWVVSSHQVAKFWSSTSASDIPRNIQGWLPSAMTGLISFLSWALSRVFSSTTIQKHQFFSSQPFLRSSAHIHTWPLGET